MARRLGVANVISLDMGGTTTKASVIEEYEIRRSSEYEVGAPISRGSRLNKGGGYLLRTPAIDIAEVGAGGGSILNLCLPIMPSLWSTTPELCMSARTAPAPCRARFATTTAGQRRP
jgi:N-methylhydantoinase A/oxoprolinase/acetone carboxylase beta subunit